MVPQITRQDGWAVLNGDDPRVFAMRATIKAQPWVFSRDPDSPAIREVLSRAAAGPRPSSTAGSRCSRPDGDPDPLVELVDVPMTLAGLSPLQRRERPGRGVGGAGDRHPARRRDRGAAHLPARRRAQPRPDEHLLASATSRGHRPGPQRGRARGAARGHERRTPPGRAAAARARRGRRPTGRPDRASSARSAPGTPTSW